MIRYMVMRLKAPMQKWGGISMEMYRPTENFPVHSGLVGLLGACMGFGRQDYEALSNLSENLWYAVRNNCPHKTDILTDFHTVSNTKNFFRNAMGRKSNTATYVTQREYLTDADFSVLLYFKEGFKSNFDEVELALTNPRYTPFLGAKCCIPSEPLFRGYIEGETLLEAFSKVPPGSGLIVSPEPVEGSKRVTAKDVRRYVLCDGEPHKRRMYLTRECYMITQ